MAEQFSRAFKRYTKAPSPETARSGPPTSVLATPTMALQEPHLDPTTFPITFPSENLLNREARD